MEVPVLSTSVASRGLTDTGVVEKFWTTTFNARVGGLLGSEPDTQEQSCTSFVIICQLTDPSSVKFYRVQSLATGSMFQGVGFRVQSHSTAF